MKTFPAIEAAERSLALIAEIEKQTDRGAAIVGAAWVEEALLAALHSFLEHDKSAWDRLFRKSGPLSSFSAKIDLSRLLGMTSSAITSDLHIVRDVRNSFAHSLFAKDDSRLAFSTRSIGDKCLALRCVAHERHTDPRTAYIRACSTLNSDFYFFQFTGHRVSDGGRIETRATNT